MAESHHVFARSLIVDNETHNVYIDGVRLPYWLSEEPQIETQNSLPVTKVVLSMWVDGVVEVRNTEGPKVIDPVLGDVGEWARRKVREDLLANFPWLDA